MTQTLPQADPSAEVRWRAVLERSAAFDGAFVYGVRSTGVYCRPSCPARWPRRENVSFFEGPDSARAAGYRPCLRCTPHGVSAHARAVAAARHALETRWPSPTLAELGEVAGMSPFHLQRVFKRLVGVSPKGYAMHLRAARLRQELKEGSSVTTAIYEAGHTSPSTVYASETDPLGMTPGAYKRGGAGQEIIYALADSPLGRLLVAATGRGLCAVRLGEDDEALVAELREEYPRAALARDDTRLRAETGAILAFLAGREQALDLETDAPGTGFQRRVWEALRTIPRGETRSYTQVAEMIGAPRAARAVARACATNPLALVVPCHRVVGARGALSGYRWGLGRKRALLEGEAG